MFNSYVKLPEGTGGDWVIVEKSSSAEDWCPCSKVMQRHFAEVGVIFEAGKGAMATKISSLIFCG